MRAVPVVWGVLDLREEGRKFRGFKRRCLREARVDNRLLDNFRRRQSADFITTGCIKFSAAVEVEFNPLAAILFLAVLVFRVFASYQHLTISVEL